MVILIIQEILEVKESINILLSYMHNRTTNLSHPALLPHRYDPFLGSMPMPYAPHNFSSYLSLHSDLSGLLVFEYVVSKVI